MPIALCKNVFYDWKERRKVMETLLFSSTLYILMYVYIITGRELSLCERANYRRACLEFLTKATKQIRAMSGATS
jgi:hypothetical protein